ncbi:MAG: hypothetical protein QW324_08685 [Thermofilaceae archaeon]
MEEWRRALLRMLKLAGRRYVVVTSPRALRLLLRFRHAYLEGGAGEA